MKDNLANFRQKEVQENPEKQEMTVDVSQFPNLKCVKCGCEGWDQIHVVKLIPSVVSPSGKGEIAPVPTLICHKCGEKIQGTLDTLNKPKDI